MTIEQWLLLSERKLIKVGIETYHLDSLILLSYVAQIDRTTIIAYPKKILSQKQISKLNLLLNKRLKHLPIAYILGMKEFYGREFIVNKNVLIPRPESESFLDLLKKHNITHQNIIDVGCGSGILGISTKLELPTNQVTLSDLSPKALKVAKQNAKNLNAKCNFIQSDSLPINCNPSIVVANLPYVPKNLDIQPELSYEPPIALFADNSGMSLYGKLWKQISQNTSIKVVLTESLKAQHKNMKELAITANYKLLDTNGLVQFFEKNTKAG